jgi:hypothetical protein
MYPIEDDEADQTSVAPSTPPMDLILNLAECFMHMDHPQFGADSLVSASAKHPQLQSSPLLWLTIGRSLLATGDIEGADAALTQARLLFFLLF